jgi:lon-related putative ATP-dependent protease
MNNQKLKPEHLYQPCDPEEFSFETTEELEELSAQVGQPRAAEALRFGMGVKGKGFNIFALGPPGSGKHSLLSRVIGQRAQTESKPPDICYVNNFDEPQKPSLLRVPAGRGVELRSNMERLLDEVRSALKAALESEEFQARKQSLEEEFKEKQEKELEELRSSAQEHGLTLMRTVAGLIFAPVVDGEVIAPDEFDKLPKEEQERVESDVRELEAEAQRMIQKFPAWKREMQEKARELSRETAAFAVNPLLDELRGKYEDLGDVVEYLNRVQKDLIENAKTILQPSQAAPAREGQPELATVPVSDSVVQGSPGLDRYRVNVLVDHSDIEGAPIVYEDNPTFANLVGRVEHLAHMGALVTDFNMIRAGALHKANGGYLILDARKVLMQPFAWEGLKRVLKSEHIKIEALGANLSLISTVSLEPEAVPLKIKVAVLGDPLLYYLLREYDPEFSDLFKIAADFDTQIVRSRENQDLYAQLIGSLIKKEGLRPFDRTGVARVVEESSRMVRDAERLSLQTRNVADLVREAEYWAEANGSEIVSGKEVQKAIDARIYRSDRLRQRLQEEILRNTILIDTEERKVGQANGLSVLQLGDYAFGRPSRITAQIRMGKGEVIDIEREVALSGPIHSKGVLILAGFLGGRYAGDQPLSLSASLVFEQSYSGIEGDSASSAELYALLSAISEVPIKQSLAVTGSVNQHGAVQAIGGVNEKIEGFFDVCQARGLTGDQGVIIPSSNVKNLMLKEDVIEAAKTGDFHVYAVENIDQGMELLTDLPAGELNTQGEFPENSLNGKVRARLKELAVMRQSYLALHEPTAESISHD